MMSKAYLYSHHYYPDVSKTTLLSPSVGKQIRLYSIRLQQANSSATDVGLFKKFSSSNYKIFTIDGSSVATEVTSTINAGSNVNIFTTSTNSGYAIQSDDLFNMIGFNIQTASTGSPVYTYQYYNGSMTSLTKIVTNAPSSTGSRLLIFSTPVDQVAGSSGITGLDTGKYTVIVRATTAPGVNVVANKIWIGRVLEYQYGMSQYGSLEMNFDKDAPYVLESQEGVLPYFGTANTANLVSSVYSNGD